MMASDYQEWLIKADKENRARFVVEQDQQAKPSVTVHIETSAKDEPERAVACSLESLERVVKRGENLRDTLEFKPSMAVRTPDSVLELDDCTAKFHARLTPEGHEQLAINIESKTQTDREGKPARVVTDHDKLQTYAEAGQEYREALSHAVSWYPIIRIEGPGADRDEAVARVVAQASDQVDDRTKGKLSIDAADKYANRDNKSLDLFFLESPGKYLPVGAEFRISKSPDDPSLNSQATKLNNAIEFTHFHPERDSGDHVIGRWTLPGDPPRPGDQRKVVWHGNPREKMTGKPLDYLVGFDNESDGRGVPADAPYVRIRKSDRRVEDVCQTRDEAVASLREAVSRDRTMQQGLTPNWHQELRVPQNPDTPKR